jgi:hypothetical protein
MYWLLLCRLIQSEESLTETALMRCYQTLCITSERYSYSNISRLNRHLSMFAGFQENIISFLIFIDPITRCVLSFPKRLVK